MTSSGCAGVNFLLLVKIRYILSLFIQSNKNVVDSFAFEESMHIFSFSTDERKNNPCLRRNNIMN